MYSRACTTYLLVIAAIIASCEEPAEEEHPFSGITMTDKNGVILGTTGTEDPDEWGIKAEPDSVIDAFVGQDTGQTAIPTFFSIHPAYPNPAADSISFIFSMPLAVPTRFEIIDTSLTVLDTLVNEILPPGHHRLRWYLTDECGEKLPPDFYRCLYEWQVVTSSDDTVMLYGYGDIQIEPTAQ